MAHPYDEFADIGFGRWAALGVKLGGRSVVDQALRDEIKFVRQGNEIIIVEKPKQRQGAVPPPNGVEFTLTLENPIGGLELVPLFGDNPKGWRYTGQPMTGSLTRRFKLVGISEGCRDLDEVRDILTQRRYGIPQGQWLQALLGAYPRNDGDPGPIGIADPSWVGRSGKVRFPALVLDGRGWVLRFEWAKYERDATWRWLVEA